MKLQVAIDRVSKAAAREMIEVLRDSADIIEIGTSLIKDFGLTGSVAALRECCGPARLLADVKTCDEGAYEFERSFEAGADIVTVMGFSSEATLQACAETARRFGKDYMIDLMELDEERVRRVAAAFPDAILCVHLPSDKNGEGLEERVRRDLQQFPAGARVAVAGGVKQAQLPLFRELGVEIVIVGGAITKAEDMRQAAEEFAAASI